MSIAQKVNVVNELQTKSVEVFKAILPSLVSKFSEIDIAEIAKKEFRKRGIYEFWYTVPFIVLIGTERFEIGTTTLDYSIKSPQKNIYLKDQEPVHIDFSPMDSKTKIWGDWSTTLIFHPKDEKNNEKISFLKEIRNIQRSVTTRITSKTTGAEIANYYLEAFAKKGITLLDVRNNVGHSICEGPKEKAQRIWLDQNNTKPLGEGIFTIEPGGIREKNVDDGKVVGRFEECIYIPKEGNAIMLGSKELMPLFV